MAPYPTAATVKAKPLNQKAAAPVLTNGEAVPIGYGPLAQRRFFAYAFVHAPCTPPRHAGPLRFSGWTSKVAGLTRHLCVIRLLAPHHFIPYFRSVLSPEQNTLK